MRYAFEKRLKPWRDCHILDITAEMILARHRELTENHGPPQPTWPWSIFNPSST